MLPTAAQLEKIAGFDTSDSNVNSIIIALKKYGKTYGLDVPHRLAHYLAQTSHESGGFKYDREIASGAAYEGRADLGNTQPGDGKRFKGRTGMQLTGRYNYRAFTEWCRKFIGNNPDFEADPDAINADPWEGLVPIYFWSIKKLNRLADENNIEQITKKINGGRNGLDDRMTRYTRSALVLLGYQPTSIEAFQRDSKAAGVYAGAIDNDDGPKTRAALHMTLAALSAPSDEVKPAPVVTVEEKTIEVPVETEVAVVPKGADKPGIGRWFGGFSLVGLGTFITDLPMGWKIAAGVIVVLAIIALLWRGEQIAMRAKRAIKAFED
jgi:putative chitinase